MNAPGFFRMTLPNLDDSPEVTPVDTSFGDILTEYEQSHHAGGQTLEGTVVSVTPDGVFLTIGRKMDGVLPPDPTRQFQPGGNLLFRIGGGDEQGNYRRCPLKVATRRDGRGLEPASEIKAAIGGRG